MKSCRYYTAGYSVYGEVFMVYVCVSNLSFHFRIMLKALEDVLNDESFHIPLEPAATVKSSSKGHPLDPHIILPVLCTVSTQDTILHAYSNSINIRRAHYK